MRFFFRREDFKVKIRLFFAHMAVLLVLMLLSCGNDEGDSNRREGSVGAGLTGTVWELQSPTDDAEIHPFAIKFDTSGYVMVKASGLMVGTYCLVGNDSLSVRVKRLNVGENQNDADSEIEVLLQSTGRFVVSSEGLTLYSSEKMVTLTKLESFLFEVDSMNLRGRWRELGGCESTVQFCGENRVRWQTGDGAENAYWYATQAVDDSVSMLVLYHYELVEPVNAYRVNYTEYEGQHALRCRGRLECMDYSDPEDRLFVIS